MKDLLIKSLRKIPFLDHLYRIRIILRDYLGEYGWNTSVYAKMPLNKHKEPIPWLTYPFMRFIEPRLKTNFEVYEYGSGNSTLWFSKRINKITSIEHDKSWFEITANKLNEYPSIDYNFIALDEGYSSNILKYHDQFDIIIIDGRERVQCAKNSLKALKDDGIIIWDNSERIEYKEGYDYLINNGFKRLDFFGLSPINYFESATSVFYRTKNNLMI